MSQVLPAPPDQQPGRLRRDALSPAGVVAHAVATIAPTKSGAFITYLAACPAVLAGFTASVARNHGAPPALAGRYAPWLADRVLLAGGLCALFCGLAVHNTISRTIFAMGREGSCPGPSAARAVRRLLPVHRGPHGRRPAHPGVVRGRLHRGVAVSGAARAPGRAAVAAAGFAAALAGAIGSLYYCFVEAAPGAGIPGPYRAVPVLAAVVVAAGAGAAVLRARTASRASAPCSSARWLLPDPVAGRSCDVESGGPHAASLSLEQIPRIPRTTSRKIVRTDGFRNTVVRSGRLVRQSQRPVGEAG